MSGNTGSLILDSAEKDNIAMTAILKWLQDVKVTGAENNIGRNLYEFWKKKRAECKRLEFKNIENYFTATLWNIGAEYVTVNLSDNSPNWEIGNLPRWKDAC